MLGEIEGEDLTFKTKISSNPPGPPSGKLGVIAFFVPGLLFGLRVQIVFLLSYEYAEHIEKKILEEGYSPGAVLGEIEEEGLTFKTKVSKTTLYRYIANGVLGVTNKDLLRKDFPAGFSLSQNQKRFLRTLFWPFHTIHFPVSRRFPALQEFGDLISILL